MRIATWETDTQFNTDGILTDVEVEGSGLAAYLRLTQTIDDNDIPFTTSGNYLLSDVSKLEISLGKARLKQQTGGSNTWPFTVSGNYAFDSAVVEVDGGAGKLKDLRPSSATFYANYASDINGTWGDGVLTGTGTGSPVVTSGELDLTADAIQYVGYDPDANADSLQTGCIRVLFRPNYSGTPITDQFFICQGNTSNSNNLLVVYHRSSNGNLRIVINNASGVNIVAVDLGAWSPVSGTQYEIEINFNLDASPTVGATRLFVDGTQFGSTQTGVGTRTDDFTIFRTGAFTNGAQKSNYKLDDLIVFSSVQHTANYTPGQSIPQTVFDLDDPDIIPNTGWAYSVVLSTFTEVATKTGSGIQYQISSDDGVTWEYWNGSSWATITASQTDSWYYDNESNTAAVVNTNISSFDASGTFKFRAFLHSDDGSQSPSLDYVEIQTNATFSTDDNLYVDTTNSSQVSPSVVNQWLTTAFTETLPANTDVKILVSTDGRTTWQRWSGSAWGVSSSPTQRSDGSSISDVETNISSLAAGNETLDFRIFLYTSDNMVTPEVDNINVTSLNDYPSTGSYFSKSFVPAGGSPLLGQKVEYDIETPTGTSAIVEIQFLANAVFEGGLEEYENGELFNKSGTFIQWRVTMNSNGSATPELNWLKIYFSLSIDLLGADSGKGGLWY